MSLIDDLFHLLWGDFVTLAPHAHKVTDLLLARGETVAKDHIALQTFAHERVDIEILDRCFVEAGYEPIESYELDALKLTTCHYEDPSGRLPKVLISALLLDDCSVRLRELVGKLIAQLPPGLEADWRFAVCGRRWSLSHSEYLELLEESPMAAWIAAFGFRASHFSVAAHELTSFGSLHAVQGFMAEQGVALGEIVGSQELGLEQIRSRAEGVSVDFVDGPVELPSSSFEFSYRHKRKGDDIFSGFIADSLIELSTEASVGLGK